MHLLRPAMPLLSGLARLRALALRAARTLPIALVWALAFASAWASGAPAGAAEIIDCGALAPVVGRACAVAAGTDGQTLVQGDVLADGRIYRGGGVLVDVNGDVACSGCGCNAPDATVVRCPESVISPGLINAYDHITFDQNAPAFDTGERYEQRHDWRSGKRGHTRILAPGAATTNQIRWAELRQLMSGTTSASAGGGAAGLIRNLDSPTNQGLGIPVLLRDAFPLGDSGGTQLASGCAYPAIATSASIESTPAYLPVIGEGIDDVAHNELLCTNAQAPGGQDLIQSKTAIGKGLAFQTGDLQRLRFGGAKLIWSPRSNLRLYGDTARVTAAEGVEIALATDWIVSGSMNLLRELGCADAWNRDYLASHFSQEELWRMATKNAADATATNARIGTISVGRAADLAVFDASSRSDYDAILNAQAGDVLLVMRAGKVLYGEAATLAEIPNTGSCDALDVCGASRAVCLLDEVGLSLDSLQTSVGSAYPLFFCGTPANEPTCTPQRTVSVSGSTIYDGTLVPTDLDGDGLANESDSCPTIFNPVRPLDAGVQPDADGDGTGDECDPTPVPEPGLALGTAGALGVVALLARTGAARNRREAGRR